MSTEIETVPDTRSTAVLFENHHTQMTAASCHAHATGHPPGSKSDGLNRLMGASARLSERALDGHASRVKAMLPVVSALVREIAPQMHARAAKRARGHLLREVLAADHRCELPTVALAAAELYRLALREMPIGAAYIPLRVGLLNYTGLKLQALTRQRSADWLAMHAAIGEAAIYTPHLEKSRYAGCLDGSLRRAVVSLSNAAYARDIAGIANGAQRLVAIAKRLAEPDTRH